METQKTVNFLNGYDNENTQHLQQKNGVLLMMNQMVIIHQMMKLSF